MSTNRVLIASRVALETTVLAGFVVAGWLVRDNPWLLVLTVILGWLWLSATVSLVLGGVVRRADREQQGGEPR